MTTSLFIISALFGIAAIYYDYREWKKPRLIYFSNAQVLHIVGLLLLTVGLLLMFKDKLG